MESREDINTNVDFYAKTLHVRPRMDRTSLVVFFIFCLAALQVFFAGVAALGVDLAPVGEKQIFGDVAAIDVQRLKAEGRLPE